MRKILTSFCVIASVFAVAACSDGAAVNNNASAPAERGLDVPGKTGNEVPAYRGDSGHYKAVLTDLTKDGKVNGEATFVVDAVKTGEFTATVAMNGLEPGGAYFQNMHFASSCDLAKPDTTKPSKPDQQTKPVKVLPYGGILIPLDGDLNTQMARFGEWEAADADGHYAYEQTASYDTMFADLTAEDPDLNDQLVKLGAKSTLVIEGRAVVVQQCTSQKNIIGDASDEVGAEHKPVCVPVACGLIVRQEEGKKPAPVESGKPEVKPTAKPTPIASGKPVDSGKPPVDSGKPKL